MTVLRRMATGAGWVMGLRFFNRGLGFASTIVLARLLVPADFGLVAMATAVWALITTMSELGVEASLVYKKAIDRVDMDSAFTLRLLMAVGQMLVLGLPAGPVAAFYDEPRIETIMLLLALVVLIDGCKNIATVEFHRELRYDREFVLMGVPKMLSFVVTISVAVLTRSYWALVVGIVVNRVAHTVMSYLMRPYRPGLSRRRWGEIFRFSRWLVVNNALYFINRRGAEFVLGRFGGAGAVGIFSVSYEISHLPTTELVAPINRVAFPGYSRMDAASGELAGGYLGVVGIVALIALPAGWGIAVTAPLLIPLLLGANWTDAIPIVEMLAFAGGVQVLQANTGAVFMAQGRPYILTTLTSMRVGLLVFGMIWGAAAVGVMGVALAHLVVVLVTTPVQLAVAVRQLSLPAPDLLRALYRPLCAAVVMYLTMRLWGVPALTDSGVDLITATLLGIGAGAAIYGTVVWVLWALSGWSQGAESRTMRLIADSGRAGLGRFRSAS